MIFKSVLSSAFVFTVCVYSSTGHTAEKRVLDIDQRYSLLQPVKSDEILFSSAYMSFAEWKLNSLGRYVNMSVAPVYEGLILAPEKTNPPLFSLSPKHDILGEPDAPQAEEFLEVVRLRNADGRGKLDLATSTPQARLESTEQSTHVVENRLITVVDRPFEEIDLSFDSVLSLLEEIDFDHFHFRISGRFAKNALEVGHIGLNSLDDNGTYVLSAFDFRDYECALLKNGIRDYFNSNSSKDGLHNESIYMISQVDINTAEDFQSVSDFIGKRPDAVIVQRVIYADHLVRGSQNIFAFYREGKQTRIVFLANIAMGSKFFTGKLGTFARQFILDGVNGGIGGGVGKVVGAVGSISDLISGAKSDLAKKNACQKGLAMGLIKYSQTLFTEFADYIENP